MINSTLVIISVLPILPILHAELISACYAVSLATLPVILFSLYFQYYKAKTWCRLCLIIVGLLAIELLTFFSFINSLQVNNISLNTILIFGSLIICIAFLEQFTKSLYETGALIEKFGIDGNKVKHAISIFLSSLRLQKQVPTYAFEEEISIGNLNGVIKIIVVNNLYCNPCREQHERIEELVKIFGEEVGVIFRFVRTGYDDLKRTESFKYLVSYWLHNIHNKPNESENTLRLLSDWYDLWDLEKFKSKYQISFRVNSKANAIVEQHYNWVKEADISSTPAFFVNSYQLPREYSVDDLIAMAPGLTAELASN